MDGDRMFELAQGLAEAKSRQDVPAAMEFFHQDMVLETPAFGTVARGLAENEQVLSRFFRSFPDYHVFEVNEAFASVVLAWQRKTGADLAKVNINGGAIAIGHPLGGSGHD